MFVQICLESKLFVHTVVTLPYSALRITSRALVPFFPCLFTHSYALSYCWFIPALLMAPAPSWSLNCLQNHRSCTSEYRDIYFSRSYKVGSNSSSLKQTVDLNRWAILSDVPCILDKFCICLKQNKAKELKSEDRPECPFCEHGSLCLPYKSKVTKN